MGKLIFEITFDSNFHCLFWQERDIGNASLSTFGVAQAVIEIILMLYPLLCVILKCYISSSLVFDHRLCVFSEESQSCLFMIVVSVF